VRAAILALVWGLLLVLGTPGLDAIPKDALAKRGNAREVAERVPPGLMPVIRGVVWFNDHVRLPLSDLVDKVQTPLRIRQEWGLYLDGSRHCQRLEIEIDGVLVHRTKDPAHPWRAGLLRAPPVRPIVDGAAGKESGGGNWRGLMRLVVHEALADAPETRRVVARGMWGPFPGCVTEVHHTFVADAPDWEARRL
jgi:hypothetical protein